MRFVRPITTKYGISEKLRNKGYKSTPVLDQNMQAVGETPTVIPAFAVNSKRLRYGSEAGDVLATVDVLTRNTFPTDAAQVNQGQHSKPLYIPRLLKKDNKIIQKTSIPQPLL